MSKTLKPGTTMKEDQRILLTLVDISEAVTAASSLLGPAEKAQDLEAYRQFRELAQATTTVAGWKSLRGELLTRWNESVGPDVEKFWSKVTDAGLDLPRRDIVREVLEAGRLSNPHLYFELEDHFEVLQTSGKISYDEALELERILDAFGNASENQYLFDDDEEPVEDDEPETFEVPVGRLGAAGSGQYRYDYWGMERFEWLNAMGYQGGGCTWASIVYGLLALRAPELVPMARIDDSSDAVSVWSSDVEVLQAVAALVLEALSSDELLREAIAAAEAVGSVE
jgi:hypothetical protein